MNARVAKGKEIANTAKLRERDGMWLVPSQTGKGTGYVVSNDGEKFRCTCPDFELRHHYCKHIYAVCLTITQTEEECTTRTEHTAADGAKTVTTTTVKRKTYRQQWTAYNAAQTSEKAEFLRLLHALCAGIQEPKQEGRGRPRVPLADMLFASVFKVYSTFSGRRFMTDLGEAHTKGYLSRAPHYNTIAKYLELADLTPILKELVTVSSLPLAAVERDFAVDSSGFSSCRYTRWFDTKHGDIPMEQHDWKKVHLMCGVTTNIVTAAEATDGYAADSPQFAELVNTTAKGGFTLRQVSGDKAYSSKFNVAYVATLGAAPLIPFKENATGGDGPMTIWRRLFHFYSFKRDTFLAHYHKRSNVESTFFMIKAKFGEALRSKTDTAQFNEALCKVLAHNLCVVIQSMHELGIAPEFAPVQAA